MNGVTRTGAAAPPSYVDRIKPTGRVALDALLAGGRSWFHEAGADGRTPSSAARHTLTFSFIDSSSGLAGMDAKGFKALTAEQRQRVRDALAAYSAVIDVSFTEVDRGADIQYGANTQTRSAGYATYPGSNTRVMLAANQSTFQGDWAAGSYEWEVLLHETGHAMGLKHPGNYNAGGGGTPGPYLPAANDNRANTVMSYHDVANGLHAVDHGSYGTIEPVNPDTLQSLDIAALQYLYGAAQGSSAQTYSFTTDSVFSRAIWNPNAGSSIDLSNQSANNVLDLRAGHKSSIAPRAPTPGLGKRSYTGANNLTIAEGSHFTAASGGSGNDSFVANGEGDTLAGNGGDDRIFWTGGNLAVDGGDGTDTVFVKKVKGAKWTLSDDKSTLTLSRTDAKTGTTATLGTVSMCGIEAVRFWDGNRLAAMGKALSVTA